MNKKQLIHTHRYTHFIYTSLIALSMVCISAYGKPTKKKPAPISTVTYAVIPQKSTSPQQIGALNSQTSSISHKTPEQPHVSTPPSPATIAPTTEHLKQTLASTPTNATSIPTISENTTKQAVPDMVEIVAEHTAKTTLLLCFLEEQSGFIEPLIPALIYDLMFSDQIAVTSKKISKNPTKKDIQQLFTSGYPLALFITQGKEQSIEWRLFDTLQGTMINGKRCAHRTISNDGWAHALADSVWPTLTGQAAFFSTKIAYCKQIESTPKKRIKHVYIADYNGNNEQVVVNLPTIAIAPRWNNDLAHPVLFYSEHTNENIRLMSVYIDTKTQKIDIKRRIASNLNGVTMLPAFSQDGKKVAYCASHGNGNCQLYYGDKGILSQITHNSGNNICPSFADNDSSIIFCSDYQTGQPQIYKYHIHSTLIERITHHGYCASPCYSNQRNAIAYGKLDQGVMQLYLYDCTTKKHIRLTENEGNKEEFSWSPCGNYLLFSIEKNKKSRIALLNLLTKEQKYITSANHHCSYPAWSPVYHTYIHL